jgi:hypothetical protein
MNGETKPAKETKRVKRMWLIHRTADVAGAETNAVFGLRYTDATGNGHRYCMPDVLPLNERERQATDMYLIPEGRFKDVEVLTTTRLRLELVDPAEWSPPSSWDKRHAWLPDAIFVIAETVDGEFVVLVQKPTWNRDQWFDKGNPSHDLN